MPSWKQVVLLVVFGSVMLTGTAFFIVTVDHDYHYSLEEQLSERPESYPVPYEDLPSAQQTTVDAAIDGKSFVFQQGSSVPPTLVEKDGAYYRFNSKRSFDWTDPDTSAPAAVTLLGFGGVVALVRRDMRRNAF